MDDQRTISADAARRLHMDENTLRKYAKVVGVRPEVPSYDRRLRTYSADDLGKINERYRHDRRQLSVAPVRAPSGDTPRRSSADLQGQIDDLKRRVARLEAEHTRVVPAPLPAPAPALAPLSARPTPGVRHRLSALPPGMMSRTDVADRHTFPRTTLIGWCRDGRVETSPETYGGEYGQFRVERPVTPRGLAQFYQRAIQRRDFTPCKECPHEHDEAAHPLEPREE